MHLVYNHFTCILCIIVLILYLCIWKFFNFLTIQHFHLETGHVFIFLSLLYLSGKFSNFPLKKYIFHMFLWDNVGIAALIEQYFSSIMALTGNY